MSNRGRGFPPEQGVRRVAVDAPRWQAVSRMKTHGKPGERALALQAAIDLVDQQRPGRFPLQRLQAVGVGDLLQQWRCIDAFRDCGDEPVAGTVSIW